MKLGFGVDEIKAVAFVLNPIVFDLCAAINEPGWVGGADVVVDFGDETAVIGWENFGTKNLIFDDVAADDESVHGFGEDDLVHFAGIGVHLGFGERAEERWVGVGWSLCWNIRWNFCRCFGWWSGCFGGR